jgi:hypothetical protein
MLRILAAALASVILGGTAMAGGNAIQVAPGPDVFSLNDYASELDRSITSPRYARPGGFIENFEIPDLAGAPVPVDPVDLVGAYQPGELVLRRGYVGVRETYDAKGTARFDRPVHHRRDGPRMAW